MPQLMMYSLLFEGSMCIVDLCNYGRICELVRKQVLMHTVRA